MITMLLAVVTGVVFGRWMGTLQAPKGAMQKVRANDLRRHVQTRR